MPNVTVSQERETENRTNFLASVYNVKLSEKAIGRLADGKIDLYETIAKRSRIQKDIEIPPPEQLASSLAEDFEALTIEIGRVVADYKKANPA